MAAANPSPRRSSDDADGARGGGNPRRGTSHGVALASAIGLTLLLLVGRCAFIGWMNDVERRPVVAPEPAKTAATEERSPRLPVAVEAERREAPVAAPPATASADAPFAPPLPAWRIECEVVDAAGPIVDATVDLVLDRGGLHLPLATVKTGADGHADHAIAATIIGSVPVVARESVAVVGVARASRHHLETRGAAFDPASGVCSLRFELMVGAAARGRVVDASGAPVANAMVRALVLPDWWEAFEAWSDALGRFELPILSPDRWRVRVSARHGVGGIASIDVTPFADVDLGDLVLVGRGFVGGRTVDREGHPLARVNVGAQGVGDTPDDLLAERPAIEERDGRIVGEAWSQADGTFRIEGLATGRYRLDTPFERSTEQGGMALHPLGDSSAELVVERHRLRVYVVDEAGATVLEAECLFKVGEREASALRVGSLVLEEDGSVAVDARAGERVVVTARLAGCTPVEGEHTFGSDDEEAELRLVLRPRGERTGAIELAIVDEAGKSVSPATVTVRTPLGAIVEGWYRKQLPESGRIEPIAAGGYLLETLAGAPIAAGFPGSSFWFPDVRSVEVREGAPTPVTVRVREGGRLRFKVRPPPGFATDLSQARLDHRPALPAQASLSVVYCLEDDGTVHLGGADFTPEVTYLSAPLLEPGTHRYEFSAPGFVVVLGSFTIRAGQITDLDLHLEPE